MNRKQRIALAVGVILLTAAVLSPPWSYYRGEIKMVYEPGTDVEPCEIPPVPAFQQALKPVHIIRGVALLAIFAVTVGFYLRFGSQPARGETEAVLGRRPGRATQIFWAVTVVVIALAFAIPCVLLLTYLIRVIRGKFA